MKRSRFKIYLIMPGKAIKCVIKYFFEQFCMTEGLQHQVQMTFTCLKLTIETLD